MTLSISGHPHWIFLPLSLKSRGLLTIEFPYCSLTSLSAFFGDSTEISANAKRSHSPFKLAFPWLIIYIWAKYKVLLISYLQSFSKLRAMCALPDSWNATCQALRSSHTAPWERQAVGWAILNTKLVYCYTFYLLKLIFFLLLACYGP